MVIEPAFGTFGSVSRLKLNQHHHKDCQQKEAWSALKCSGRWLRWLWTSENTLDTSRRRGSPNYHRLWKLHTGLQATWILCLSTLLSDSGTLISKIKRKILSNFFQSTLHLICFDTALCEEPHLSVITLCDLPFLWKVSMFFFWTIAKSAVFPIIVFSENKRYPECIL